jgi:hypothetical protein
MYEAEKRMVAMLEQPKIKAAQHLTDGEYELFVTVYCKHLQSMGEAYRADYTVDKIKKIERNHKESCFNVYYQKDWYHYDINNYTWY